MRLDGLLRTFGQGYCLHTRGYLTETIKHRGDKELPGY